MSNITTNGNGLIINGSVTAGQGIGTSIIGTSSVADFVTKNYVDGQFYVGEGINIIIEDDEKLSSLLSLCYKEIRDNFIVFNVFMDHVRQEPNPIEDVMRMISKKQIFDFTITRDGYKLDVKEARFTKIKNLIETSANQYIEVEFVSESMEYDNTLKSELQKRSEKMELLKHKINDK